ncbi:MAG TPA: hypothetical protein VJW77_13135 [Terriglobia bacterium]|nr:hypothetical protein [Terriglobia bacterium]
MKPSDKTTSHPSRRTFLQTALGALAAEQALPALGEAAENSSRPQAGATRLFALPQFLRPGPFGDIVRADRGAAAAANGFQKGHRLSLECPRGGYASFHLVAQTARPGEYSLDLQLSDRSGKIQADLYREWFHRLRSDDYYPDALVPVQRPYRSRLPDPDNKIANQTAQAFWVDVWVPPDAEPGDYSGRATLQAGGTRRALELHLKVLPAVVPAEDVVAMDHNSYGDSWIAAQFPARVRATSGDFYKSDELFRLIHSYHRIFYENHGIFHQLGYGHAGHVTPEFAPALEGEGRGKRVANWDLYDRHYGPLLDGSAFAGTRRGPTPIPYAYLPINPEWPASWIWWGQPGYEAEFTNVVGEMEKHFRQKGWTRTHLEMFFNHKKRYMGFSWDGDEVRFPKDLRYFHEFGRLLNKALPADTPVRFVFRADVSWDMEQQFRELDGVVNMWTCGGGILSWYQGAPKMLRERGDIVLYYGGPPGVTEPASAITEFVLRAWVWDTMGFVHWLAVQPGNDPWFNFTGGGTTLVYPGDRFGLRDPIPSVRLKIQRNAVQELTLLDSFKARHGIEALKAEATKQFNGSTPAEWWDPRPPFAGQPTYEWTDPEMTAATAHTSKLFAHIDADAWERVRQSIMQLAREKS